jgi:integrase
MPFRTKKSDIWQYDIIVGGDRLRGSCNTKDYEEAKLTEARFRSEAKAKAARGSSYTLSETLGTYYNDISQHQPSARTTKSQATVLLSVLGAKTIADTLTDAKIAAFVSKQRATCANATVNRRLELLGRALNYMAKTYKATIPELSLQNAKVKEPKERIRELSQGEQARLFEALPHEYHPFVSFALMTGARIATISNLEWDDVDLGNREISFRLKGDEAMIFPINAEIAALLSALPISNIGSQRRYVFTRIDKQANERVQIRPDGGTFGVAFRLALTDAGIRNFRFHDLRHTMATRMLRRTGNLKLVSKLLGHKDVETTARYAHVMMDDLRTALDDYSVFGGGPKPVDKKAVPQNQPQTRAK